MQDSSVFPDFQVDEETLLEESTPQDSSVVPEFKREEETTGEDLPVILGSSVEDEEPLVDESVFEAGSEQPRIPIYKSIPLKAGLAGVVALFLLIPTLLLLSGNLLGSNTVDTSTSESTAVEQDETEEQIALRQSEAENANLRKQLALQTQGFTAAELDEEVALEQSETAQTTAQRPNSPPVTSSPTSIRSTPPPPPRPVASRPVAPPPSRRVAPPPLPRPVVPTRATIAPPRSVAATPIDVSELSNNGNYGSLPQLDAQPFAEASDSSSAPSIFEEGQIATAAARTIPIAISSEKAVAALPASGKAASSETTRPLPKAAQDTYPTFVSNSPNSTGIELAASYEEERALILGEEISPTETTAIPSTISPGSSVQGVLSQPISWTTGMDSVRGVLTLTEPLISNGYEILPQGTQIIVAVVAFSESGAVELQPTAIVLSEAPTLNLSIPLDAIQILAADGGYPLAEIENGSERALRRIDRQQAVLGAISSAGAFINRPNSESGFFGAGGSSYSRDYGDGGSVLAAIGGGAADAILSARSERLAAQGARIADRPYIWTLPEGTGVQIFFSQEVQL